MKKSRFRAHKVTKSSYGDWSFPFLDNMILDKKCKETQKKPIFAEKVQNEQNDTKGGNCE